MVLEIDLHHLVGKAEHDRMSRAHPFLHVNYIRNLALRLDNIFRDLLVWLRFFRTFKVRAEML